MKEKKNCKVCGALIPPDTVKCPKCEATQPLDFYGYCIRSAKKGSGIVLCKGHEPHSEYRDTIKYRKKVSKELGFPVEALKKAVVDYKMNYGEHKEKEETNPGAIIVQLAENYSEEIFKDQLDEAYITYIEKMDVMDVVDISNPIVNPTTKDISHYTLPQQIYIRDSHVHNAHNDQKPTKIDIKHTVRIRSQQCKQWMAQHYYREQMKTPSSQALKGACLVLEARAKNRRKMYNRVAPDGEGGVWWDMSDEYGRAIHITKDGWKIVFDPPQIFRRYAHQLPLSMPAEKGDLTPLLDFIKLNKSSDQLLSIVTSISYIVPDIPHVIELVYGVKGSAKSSGHRFRRRIIDPSATPLLTLPKEEEQMVQHGDHHYLLIYDNVSQINKEQSDLLCRMVTGLGFSKRKLYTNDDVIIRQLKRCININGINLPVDKPDILDRSIIQSVDIMEDSDRKTESVIQKEMNEKAPYVIRGILDTLVKAIKLYDEVNPVRNNRMADFTHWGCAITEALGLPSIYFEKAYAQNIETQNEEAVKSSPVAEWLIRWFDYNNFKHGYTGSASDILDNILTYAKQQYERDLNWVEGWPKGARPFGKKLKEIIPNLNEVGYRIVYKKSGTRKYNITKIVHDKEDKTTVGQRSLGIALEEREELTPNKLWDVLKEVDPVER